MTVGVRYRIVTRTDREEFVSRVVLAADEVQEALELEAQLHNLTGGWRVSRVLDGRGELVSVFCEGHGRSREVSARALSPMEDGKEEP